VHQVILSNPLLKADELGLKARFGLEYIYPDAAFDSSHDPSRAPAGHAVFGALTFAPYNIDKRGGAHWDSLKETWPGWVLRDLQKCLTNLEPANIIASRSYSPLDLERDSSSFVHGDIHGAAPFFHQMNGHRPTPDLAQYTVPGVDKFYLVGPFMHPGPAPVGPPRCGSCRISTWTSVQRSESSSRSRWPGRSAKCQADFQERCVSSPEPAAAWGERRPWHSPGRVHRSSDAI